VNCSWLTESSTWWCVGQHIGQGGHRIHEGEYLFLAKRSWKAHGQLQKISMDWRAGLVERHHEQHWMKLGQRRPWLGSIIMQDWRGGASRVVFFLGWVFWEDENLASKIFSSLIFWRHQFSSGKMLLSVRAYTIL
jgi:hypothetical protein